MYDILEKILNFRRNKLGQNYIDKTIELIKLAFEKNKLQETDQYKRLEKLQEKRRKNNE